MGDARWSPAELDRIEDALELLYEGGAEDRDPFVEGEYAPHVRERLKAYRRIVIASRDALPIEEVPEGVLARVLEAAFEGASDEALAVEGSSSVREEPRPSRWERIRRLLLLPGFAVVGTAALVLVIVQPRRDEASPVATAREAGREAVVPNVEAASPPPSPPAEAAEADGARDQASQPALKALPVSVTPIEKSAPMGQTGAVSGGAPAPAKGKGGTADAKPSDAFANESNKDKADSAATLVRWNEQLQQADGYRRQGDCTNANAIYQRGLEADDDRIAARANAGLGLCASESGRITAADEYYGRARDLDPAVDAFIAGEHAQQRFEVDTKRRVSTRPANAKKNSKPEAPKNAAIDEAFE